MAKPPPTMSLPRVMPTLAERHEERLDETDMAAARLRALQSEAHLTLLEGRPIVISAESGAYQLARGAYLGLQSCGDKTCPVCGRENFRVRAHQLLDKALNAVILDLTESAGRC